MQTVEQIIDNQLNEFIAKFKPRFGNTRDIEIVNKLEKLKKSTVEEEKQRIKRNLLFTFKQL